MRILLVILLLSGCMTSGPGASDDEISPVRVHTALIEQAVVVAAEVPAVVLVGLHPSALTVMLPRQW